jgi:16S rRNA G527 N7-methylase RsmG
MLTLVESREKRAYFLEKVIAELDIVEAAVRPMRIGRFLKDRQEMWNIFSWKAIKIGNEDLSLLMEHAKQNSSFWMFHGKELPVQNQDRVEEIMELERQESFPYKKEWRLSIYRAKTLPPRTV